MVIIDNSTLSSLGDLNLLDLLTFFFDKVSIPKGVYDEYYAIDREYLIPQNFEIRTLTISNNKIETQLPGISGFGVGDKQVIYLAMMDKDLIISDDKKVREFSKKEGIAVMGTLRVVKNGYIHGYFSSLNSYKEIIEKLSEPLFSNNISVVNI